MSINHPIETLKLSHKDVTLDYTQVRQMKFTLAVGSIIKPYE